MRKTETIINEIIICDLCHQEVTSDYDGAFPDMMSYYAAGAKEPIIIDACYDCLEQVNRCDNPDCSVYLHDESTFISGQGDYLCREHAIAEQNRLLKLVEDINTKLE